MEENQKIRKTLLDFYASYIIRQIDLDSSNENQTKAENLLQINLLNPPMNFQIDFPIVNAIMELLCDEFIGKKLLTSFEKNGSREYLMNIWFSNSQRQMKVTKVNDPNSTVDILPHNLKMKMLSAYDQRIVKVMVI